ncbi:hypothetical protein GYMLUDRAFT_216928 [Collybiopsis luxurians FD-317 M1]|nr:hypothetical protein GYMLUDRAFT_216928 [Collybiopsis luxurians FD-317 M1]
MLLPLSFSSSSSFPSSSPFQVLASWGLSSADHDSPAGLILGLQDGSALLLRPSQKQTKTPSSLPSPTALSRASLATSRSNSPSGSHISPFSVTPRSRIVSGITTEQVEAPKAYVDFDDEPDKLKDMLKGRSSHSHRGSFDLHRDNPVIDWKPSNESSTASGKRRKDAPKSMLSATASPALTPSSISAPPSPRGPAPIQTKLSKDLELVCHIVPPNVGQKSRVVDIQLLHNNEFCAVLRESGDLAIISNQDGKCFINIQVADTNLSWSDGVKHSPSVHDVWAWVHLRSYVAGERTLLLASAMVSPESVSTAMDSDENSRDRCRVVLFELLTNHLIGNLEMRLDAIGQWFCDGEAQTVGLHYEEDQTFHFCSLSVDGKFSVRPLHILPHAPDIPIPMKNSRESQINLGVLGPVANPFKGKRKSLDDDSAIDSAPRSGRVQLGDTYVIGSITPQNPLVCYHITSIGDVLKGVGWSENELIAFSFANGTFASLFSYPTSDVCHAQWLDRNVIGIIHEERCELYKIVNVDASGQEITSSSLASPVLVQPKLSKTILISSSETVEFISPFELLVIDQNQNIVKYTWDNNQQLQQSPKRVAQIIWPPSNGRDPSTVETNSPQLTAVMVLDTEVIILGYSDGLLRQSSFVKFCDEKFSPDDCTVCSDVPLAGKIVSLHVAKNNRTKVQFILGGGDDGSIAVWSMDLKLCARWIIFTTPLLRIAQFPDISGVPLRGVIMYIAEDGTIAVVAIDGFQFLYVIPGSPFPLQRVFLGEDNLLLAYADQRVRLWDVRTREFRRSMSLDKAEELIGQRGWSEIAIRSHRTSSNYFLRNISEYSQSLDVACTLSLDLNTFISGSLSIIKSLSTNRKQTRNILMTREHLRSILSLLLTPGLNQDIDEICYEQLGIKRTNASVGFSEAGFVSLYNCSRPEHHWSLSGDVSAARALGIVTILRALSVFEELSESAATVTAFYATGLSGPVGPTYKRPNLAYLAQRWFEGTSEFRHSSRLLFDAAVARLSDEDTSAIVDEWQHQLPCLQPTADKESALAALALFLCGHLAAEKYSMLSTSALTDIAKSITMYLHDEHSAHRVLAIDLCSRGFHVWQHYIDALEILRSLFSLATNSRKENITTQNVGAQARLAILHIASNHTPLFMTTLGLDILNPASTEHRKSVMQIVAFLIKKRPLVLYPNLPKLMEAVVKSLDPNSTSDRDAVLDTATEILGHVVKTFPNVDFHMPSQRLAVGTSEGAMVMYDLKTAIRLYVLEGHTKRIAACSFSPDGRRLVTLSLEESVVLVWKVGTSFVSFFNPGAPPRQGHSGSDPFKTLSFNVGDAGNMTVAETLELVQFEWTAERSVKLKIRDSILTFST